MKLKKLILFFTICASLSWQTNASVENAKITEIRQRSGNLIVNFSKNFTDKCSDHGIWAILPNSDSIENRQYLSLLLTAAAAGKNVTVISNGCNYHNTIKEVSIHF